MESPTQPPAKRRRLSTQDSTEVDIIVDAKMSGTSTSTASTGQSNGTAYANSSGNANSRDEAQLEKERRVGITAYVNPAADGFSGVLKQRYTDFLVNEVLPDGRVLHLENLSPKKRKGGEEGVRQGQEQLNKQEVTTEEPAKEETMKEEPKDTEMVDASNVVKPEEVGSINGVKQEEGGSTDGPKQEAEGQQAGTAEQVKVSTTSFSKNRTINISRSPRKIPAH